LCGGGSCSDPHTHTHTHARARAHTHTHSETAVYARQLILNPKTEGVSGSLLACVSYPCSCCLLVLRVLSPRLHRARRCRSRLSPKPRPIHHGQGRMLLKKALFTKEGRRALKAGFRGALPASKRRMLLALLVLPLRILGALAGVLRALLARNLPDARARA
jgi:hypothetical protein